MSGYLNILLSSSNVHCASLPFRHNCCFKDAQYLYYYTYKPVGTVQSCTILVLGIWACEIYPSDSHTQFKSANEKQGKDNKREQKQTLVMSERARCHAESTCSSTLVPH